MAGEPATYSDADLDEILADKDQRIAELEAELADLKEGRTAIIPHSRDHAERLLFLAEVFWNGNENVAGWKDRNN